jgi:hypothetical protein
VKIDHTQAMQMARTFLMRTKPYAARPLDIARLAVLVEEAVRETAEECAKLAAASYPGAGCRIAAEAIRGIFDLPTPKQL